MADRQGVIRVSLIAFDYLTRVVFRLIDDAEARVILFRLFNYADEHGRRMYPGIERLAAEVRRDPMLVAGVLEDAIARNVIHVDADRGDGRRGHRAVRPRQSQGRRQRGFKQCGGKGCAVTADAAEPAFS